ncbi:hypothetical protein D3C76_1121210 [compost metagenome]
MLDGHELFERLTFMVRIERCERCFNRSFKQVAQVFFNAKDDVSNSIDFQLTDFGHVVAVEVQLQRLRLNDALAVRRVRDLQHTRQRITVLHQCRHFVAVPNIRTDERECVVFDVVLLTVQTARDRHQQRCVNRIRCLVRGNYGTITGFAQVARRDCFNIIHV